MLMLLIVFLNRWSDVTHHETFFLFLSSNYKNRWFVEDKKIPGPRVGVDDFRWCHTRTSGLRGLPGNFLVSIILL